MGFVVLTKRHSSCLLVSGCEVIYLLGLLSHWAVRQGFKNVVNRPVIIWKKYMWKIIKYLFAVRQVQGNRGLIRVKHSPIWAVALWIGCFMCIYGTEAVVSVSINIWRFRFYELSIFL